MRNLEMINAEIGFFIRERQLTPPTMNQKWLNKKLTQLYNEKYALLQRGIR